MVFHWLNRRRYRITRTSTSVVLWSLGSSSLLDSWGPHLNRTLDDFSSTHVDCLRVSCGYNYWRGLRLDVWSISDWISDNPNSKEEILWSWNWCSWLFEGDPGCRRGDERGGSGGFIVATDSTVIGNVGIDGRGVIIVTISWSMC